jgi:imidazoleglycerol-phosphate dehydratase
MKREAHIQRKTAETDITLSISLDGQGSSRIATGIGFFDHMLTLLALQSGFDLEITAEGDLDVDPHHTVEDVGIVLGQALRDALSDKAGIHRYGAAYVPMDEALVRTALDLSGRSYCHYLTSVRAKRLGTFDTELVEDFLQALASHGGITLHVDMIRGRNSHHVIEAVFKSLGRALGDAVSPSGRSGIPSTKGTLTQ